MNRQPNPDPFDDHHRHHHERAINDQYCMMKKRKKYYYAVSPHPERFDSMVMLLPPPSPTDAEHCGSRFGRLFFLHGSAAQRHQDANHQNSTSTATITDSYNSASSSVILSSSSSLSSASRTSLSPPLSSSFVARDGGSGFWSSLSSSTSSSSSSSSNLSVSKIIASRATDHPLTWEEVEEDYRLSLLHVWHGGIAPFTTTTSTHPDPDSTINTAPATPTAAAVVEEEEEEEELNQQEVSLPIEEVGLGNTQRQIAEGTRRFIHLYLRQNFLPPFEPSKTCSSTSTGNKRKRSDR
jgi:hypothetical protein